MQKHRKILIAFFIGLGLITCNVNAIGPTPPSDKFEIIEGKTQGATNLKGYAEISKNPPTAQNAIPNKNDPIDITGAISIISVSGGLLTIWATAPGNWVWGIGPRDSVSLGSITDWQIITNADASLHFRNTVTRTCLAGYSNGVIHAECNKDDKYQKWKINHFENGAIQLQNVGYGTCVQTPLSRFSTYYSISLVECVKPGVSNLDQQWSIIPPQEGSLPLIRFKK